VRLGCGRMGDKKALQKCAVLHSQFLLKVDKKSATARRAHGHMKTRGY
jgi:hypothetical protein